MKAPILVAALFLPVPAFAQSAAAHPAEEPTLSIPIGTRVGELPSGYEDGGRRDPFSSLIKPKRTATPTATSRPRTGLAALAVADAAVRGVVRKGDTMLAIVEAPGKQSFVVRVDDELADAVVESIDRDGVVFAEHLSPGTSVRIRKALRSPGEDIR